MIKIFIWSLFITTCILQNNPWDNLTDVTYKNKKSAEGFEIPFPVFGEKVKSLDGKKISLKGYIIPLDKFGGQNYFMFSSLPYNNCFFCGGAGPETVLEVYSLNKIDYTANLIEISGTLLLNDSDPDHHMYMLKNAQIVNQK